MNPPLENRPIALHIKKMIKFVKILTMTTTDLKYEINKAIEDAPESVLVDILDYLNQVKVAPKKIELTRRLGQILREDKELLQRLAL